jgi:hypothetical protein
MPESRTDDRGERHTDTEETDRGANRAERPQHHSGARERHAGRERHDRGVIDERNLHDTDVELRLEARQAE